MFEFVYKYRSLKALRRGLVSAGGRNFTGKLALLRRSGPKIHWSHCFIDNNRVKKSSHVLLRFDFNSFRNCYLMLVYDFQFGLAYHKTISGSCISQVVSDNIPSLFGTGSSIALKILSPGQVVSNINPGALSTCKYGRAPGSKITVVSFEQFQVLCKLPSGHMKKFSLSARGLLGPSSTNPYKYLQGRNKAGFYIYRGFRPAVRGVAKNPVDHPHGGGEGKKSPRPASRSPWGWVTLV